MKLQTQNRLLNLNATHNILEDRGNVSRTWISSEFLYMTAKIWSRKIYKLISSKLKAFALIKKMKR